jgi:hypothetical protein
VKAALDGLARLGSTDQTFSDIEKNTFVVTQQFTIRAGKAEKRADLVLLVNGIPLVMIEVKTPVRSSQSWLDNALQIHDDYEKNVPELFVPNVISVATEGKELRYGSVRMPVDIWGPWRDSDDNKQSLNELEKAAASMLRPAMVLDMLDSFTAFATQKGKHRIKIIARYQQVDGVNKIVERVVAGQPRKGLIWHFQGSGKSLLMLFAARKLRLHPALKNPTVLVVVDRIDLDSQISGTFYAADMANMVRAESRKELADLLAKDARKVVITTIHKFGEADGVLNGGSNIIVLVDEAHRTQEEALSPDPLLTPYETDYRWLAQIYESLKPSTGTGQLLWHRLGAKTIELIHQNVHVDAVRDDLDTLVLDADLLEAVLANPDPGKKAKEISIKLGGRLRKHGDNPKFQALSERLEDLKNRHQQVLLVSIDFLKELLALARDVVAMEREGLRRKTSIVGRLP